MRRPVPRRPVPRRPVSRHRLPPASALALLVPLALLSGCQGGAYALGGPGGIGPDNGSDPCRAQRVALDATGNYFARDMLTGAVLGATGGGVIGSLVSGDWRGALTGAAAGGAAGALAGYWQALAQRNRDQASLDAEFSGDLTRENGWIGRTQRAFDGLMACRLAEAQTIRADDVAGRIDRPTAEARLAVVRRQAGGDLALAQRIDTRINQRGAQFVYAADHLSPGTGTAIAAYHASWYDAHTQRPVALLLRPESGAAEVGHLPAGLAVSAAASPGGFALVRTGGETRGFVPASALAAPRAAPPPRPPAGDPVQTLAGSNAARRDAFAQSVAVGNGTLANGFQLSG